MTQESKMIPTALRLAELMEIGKAGWNEAQSAAAELRRLHAYVEAVQARLDEERALNEELIAALREAADDIESWGAYAGEYFQEKHDLKGSVNRARTALARATGEGK